MPVKVNPLIEGEVARTAEPEPVIALICVPLILKTLPVPAVSNVLFVKVSVVALPIKVSVVAGKVKVPDAVAVAITFVLPEVDPPKYIPVPVVYKFVIVGVLERTTFAPDPTYELI